MPKLKGYTYDEPTVVKEKVIKETIPEVVVPVVKKLREVVISGIAVNTKQPWLQLGDPNPDVIVDVRPDGITSCGKYHVVKNQWVRFRG